MTEGKKELSYAEKRANAEKFANEIIKFAQNHNLTFGELDLAVRELKEKMDGYRYSLFNQTKIKCDSVL